MASSNQQQRKINLGVFTDFIEAVAHRLAAEQYLDWPNCNSTTPAYLHMQKYLNNNNKKIE